MGRIRLLKGESGSANFGAKVAFCLWKADTGFMNSITGSGYVAKCSNILQDSQLIKMSWPKVNNSHPIHLT
jgi:hypothetical protein